MSQQFCALVSVGGEVWEFVGLGQFGGQFGQLDDRHKNLFDVRPVASLSGSRKL